ncbi:MAG TPA: hypothetical protein VIG24_18650 [Acidimicrobiia bacterium]|jgi:hypothetical protein
MAVYRIVGAHKVAGFTPGETVTSDDLVGVDVQALVAGGHLAPTKAARPATSAEADEAEHEES